MSAAELGANGIVAGVLTREGEVDVPQLSELLLLCRGLVSPFFRLDKLTCQHSSAQRPVVLCVMTWQTRLLGLCTGTICSWVARFVSHRFYCVWSAARF